MSRLVLLAGLVLLALLMAFGGSPFRLGRSKDIATVGGQGYWLLGKDGGVFNYGDAPYLGNNLNSGNDIVGIAPTPTLKGYWTADDDGTVFHYGDAHDYGSRVSEVNDISGFAARPQGDGYWLVTRAGVVTAKGGAAGHGNAPALAAGHEIVGMASTPSGNGYWLVGRDGGVFSFGDADYYGSAGALKLNKPIVGMAASPSGHGYWFVASDGGVFNYGDAAYFGSTGATPPASGVAGIAPTTTGHGYWLVAGNGKVFPFGDAPAKGDPSSVHLAQPVVGIAATPLAHLNQIPAAVADTASVAEDGSVAVDVLGNDAGLGDGGITVAVASGPAHGTASVGSDKRITYSPAANYNGSDSLTYRVTDGDGESSTATLSLTVTAVNDAPAASGASATATEDTPLTGTVHATDVDGDTLTYSVVASPAKGSLTLDPATGAYTFTPTANANGSDSFTFKANDGSADSNVATVSITVASVEDAPVFDDTSNTLSTDEDTALGLDFPASDGDGDALTYGVTDPANGTASIDSSGHVSYSPDANYHGPDSFTVSVTDGHSAPVTQLVSLTVVSVNDAPVATGASLSLTEDDPTTAGSVSATDVDGDSLTFTLDEAAGKGSAVVDPDGSFTYTPGLNQNGSDSFTIKVDDGHGGSADATVSVDITAVNDNPVVDAGVTDKSTDEDTPLVVPVTVDDVETPGTLSIYTFSSNPTLLPLNGVVLSGTGTHRTLTLTPVANASGNSVVVVGVTDPQGGFGVAVINLTVNPVNDAPVATIDTLDVNEDAASPATGTISVTDVDNSTFSFSIAPGDEAGKGTASVNPTTGVVSYSPGPNEYGPDSFVVTVSDGSGGTDRVTVNVDITEVNDPPTANDSSETTNEDQALSSAVTAGNVDPDTLSFSVPAGPANGTLDLSADGSYTYTPDENWNGSDGFTFTVSDGRGGSDTGTVDITVNPVNDAPVVDAQSLTTNEDTAISNGQLTAFDVEGDGLTYSKVAGPSHGTATVHGDGTFTYTPAADYFGSDSFTVKANDGTDDSATATISITVSPVDDAPVAADASPSVNEDTTLNGTLSASDVDNTAGELTYSLSGGQPAHGHVSILADGTYAYAPGADYHGADSFSFSVSDGQLSDTGLISITVNPVNDTPAAVADSFTIDEDTTASFTAADLMDNDSGLGDAPLQLAVQAPPGTGTLVDDHGDFTYTPPLNFFGAVSFTYRVTDVDNQFSYGTVTITVNPVNDAPTIAGAALAGPANEDSDATINFTVGDVDSFLLPQVITAHSDNSALVADDATGITVVPANPASPGPRSVILHPKANANSDLNGPVTITLTATDDAGATSDIASVPVTFNPVDDGDPVAVNDPSGESTIQVAEDSSLNSIDVLANDQNLVDGVDMSYPVFMLGGSDTGVRVLSGGLPAAPTTGIIPMLTANSVPTAHGTVTYDVSPAFCIILCPPGFGSTGTNHLLYTPAPDFHGTDTFQYVVIDRDGDVSNPATVTVTVNSANDIPVAHDDTTSVNEDASVNVAVLGNDVLGTNPALGDYPVTVAIAEDGAPADGTAVVQPDNTITYTPSHNFEGPSDTFSYTVTDANGDSSTATVTVTVNPQEDAPVIDQGDGPRALSVNEDNASDPVTFSASDPDSADHLSWSATDGTHGTVAAGEDPGSFIYTPEADFDGSDSFTVTVDDGHSGTDTIQVDVTIDNVNDAPVATDGTLNASPGGTMAGVLGASDVDGDDLTYSVVAQPADGQGSVTIDNDANGSFTYTADPTYVGQATFTFKVNDGLADSNTATVTVTVAAVNQPPVIDESHSDLNPEFSLTVSGHITASDPDLGDTLTYSIVGDPAFVSIDQSGNYTWNIPGPPSFTVMVSDGHGGSDTVVVNIGLA